MAKCYGCTTCNFAVQILFCHRLNMVCGFFSFLTAVNIGAAYQKNVFTQPLANLQPRGLPLPRFSHLTFKIAVGKNKPMDRIRCQRGSCSRGMGATGRQARSWNEGSKGCEGRTRPTSGQLALLGKSRFGFPKDALGPTYDAATAFSRCPSHKIERERERE